MDPLFLPPPPSLASLLTTCTYLFCSDNGAWTEEGLNGGSNGLLRGQKGETWEGGMRYG